MENVAEKNATNKKAVSGDEESSFLPLSGVVSPPTTSTDGSSVEEEIIKERVGNEAKKDETDKKNVCEEETVDLTKEDNSSLPNECYI